LIFHGIVQQCGDRLIFVSAMFQDDGSDGQQVRNVGDSPRSFAELIAMETGGESEGLAEARGQGHVPVYRGVRKICDSRGGVAI
jgi:hypothetical protein